MIGGPELDDLADDLANAPEVFRRESKRIMERGGVEIKRNATTIYRRISKHRSGGHTKYAPQTWSYDVSKHWQGNLLMLEVGPDLTRGRAAPKDSPYAQAALGLFYEQALYTSTGRIGEAPIPALHMAMEHEATVINDRAGDLYERILDGRTH